MKLILFPFSLFIIMIIVMFLPFPFADIPANEPEEREHLRYPRYHIDPVE